jgi:hypothetical protein
MEQEGVSREDITVITDLAAGETAPPGIHPLFDMKLFLDFFNQHILSRETLLGVLGSFGVPHQLEPEDDSRLGRTTGVVFGGDH